MLVDDKSQKLLQMQDEDNKKLCMALLHANDEDEIEQILHDLIEDESVWKPLGGINSNHSIVANQAADSISALVETIVNSEDAMLIGECLKRDINPKSNDAPQSMREAVETFFDIKDDDIEKMKDSELSKNIGVVATGSYEFPCIGVFDKGVGQNPDDFEKTLLSLPGTNNSPSKSEIPFVQGLFNMGGSGTLPYCGKRGKEYHFKLIISKRNTNLGDADGRWGFTIIRKQLPNKKHTSSTYVYLCPNNKILSFEAEQIPILPGKNPKTYEKPLEYGTYIKLYNYNLGSKAKQVQLELLYEINRQLFRPAIPFRIYEQRQYGSHTLDSAVTGLYVRLADNQSEIMEEGFPQKAKLNIDDVGEMKITIYALKKEKRKSHFLSSKHKVIFTLNGQRHYSKGEEFLTSDKVSKSYSAQDILVIVNCDEISDLARETIFMPARDRSREHIILNEVENELQDLLANHAGLNALEQSRRDEELEEVRKNKKPLAAVVERLVKNSTAFSKLFNFGVDVQKPRNFLYKTDRKNPYIGNPDPTFFRIKDDQKSFEVPQRRSANITIETDAQNDYFTRTKNRGRGPYLVPRSITWNYSLWNGMMRLHVKPNKKFKIGDEIRIQMVIKDKVREKPFELQFKLKITKPQDSKPYEEDEFYHTPWNEFWRLVKQQYKKEPKEAGKKIIETEGGKLEPALALPEFIPVTKGDAKWNEHGFDNKTGVHIMKSGNNYDFYVNMSNEYYLTELDNAKPQEHAAIHDQYAYGLLLQCLAMIHEMKEKNPEEDVTEILKKVNLASRGIAMSVVSVIRGLGISLPKK